MYWTDSTISEVQQMPQDTLSMSTSGNAQQPHATKHVSNAQVHRTHTHTTDG